MPVAAVRNVGRYSFEKAEGTPGPKAYQAYGAALALWKCKDPEVLYEGPSGSGKSRSALEKLHALAMKYPGMRALMLRKTRDSMTQSTLVTFENNVLPYPGAVPFHHDKQEYQYSNGSRIVVAGLDKDSKVLSTEFDVIYINEASELIESEYETVTTRARYGVMPYQQIIADLNPQAPGHFLNQRAIAGKMTRLISKHEDNPRLWDAEKGDWTEEGARYIATLDKLTGYRYQRLRLGLWVGAEGQYFDEWDEAKHICEPFEIPANWTRWTATDWGSADPWTTLWAARSPEDKRRVYIYRETYATRIEDTDQAKQIRRLSQNERISRYVGDPSMFNNRWESKRPAIAWFYWQQGIPIMRAYNDRIAGWRVVRAALSDMDGPPKLQVMRGRAPNLVRTLPQMVHDPLDSEDVADKIKSVKTEDHSSDCLRYLLTVEALPERAKIRTTTFKVLA